MAKVDLENVEYRMQEAGVKDNQASQVMALLKAELEEEAALRAAQPRVKKHKYIIANTDVPAGTTVTEYPMVVIEADESVQPNEVIDGIKNSIATANLDCKKLQKTPATSVFDGVERVPAKFFKTNSIRVVSKHTTQIVETDNKLS